MFSVSLVSVRQILTNFALCSGAHWLYCSSGANREVKKAVEAYWAGKLSADELTKVAAEVKKTSWTSLKERGVDLIPRYGLSSLHIDGNSVNGIITAVISPSMTTSLTTLPLSTSSPSGTWDTTCPPSMSTSPWAVDVRLMALMCLPPR